MKVHYNRTTMNKLITKDTEQTITRTMIPFRKSLLPNEAITYPEIDEGIYKAIREGNIEGEIKDTNILQMKGPEITHNNEGIHLNKKLSKKDKAFYYDVNASGLVTKTYPFTHEYLDPESSISFDKITNKPNTLEAWGIDDVVSINKPDAISSPMSVTYQDKSTKSPVPYSFIKNMVKEKGYELNIGDTLFKIGDRTNEYFTRSDGRTVNRGQGFDLLIDALAGKGTGSAKLPDTRTIEEDFYKAYGFIVKGYTLYKKRT